MLFIVDVMLLIGTLIPVHSQAPDEDYLTGCAGLIRGEYVKAVESLSFAISRNNADEQYFIKRGEAFLKLKEFDRAVNDFKEANQIYPGMADIWLARSFALSGDQGMAVLFLTSHLKSEFRLPEDSIRKDRAFDELQTTTEWYNLWQKDWYSEEETAAAEIRYCLRKRLFEEANAIIAAEMAKKPDSKVLLLLKGKTAFNQENYAAAIADYSAALNLDKYDLTIYSGRGTAYLKAGRYKDAVNDFNKALKDDPADFRLYLLRAEALAGTRSWGPAIKDLLLYLKYFDDDQAVLHRCGDYYYQAGDYMNALKCFNKNLKEDPNNSNYYKSRGKTYLMTSMYRYALSDLAMSLDLNPDDAETWMYLGIAKIRSGDKENGCSDLERARKMGNSEAVRFILDNCK